MLVLEPELEEKVWVWKGEKSRDIQCVESQCFTVCVCVSVSTKTVINLTSLQPIVSENK